jgi:hypothetical protein
VCCWLKRLYTIITNTSGWATTNPPQLPWNVLFSLPRKLSLVPQIDLKHFGEGFEFWSALAQFDTLCSAGNIEPRYLGPDSTAEQFCLSSADRHTTVRPEQWLRDAGGKPHWRLTFAYVIGRHPQSVRKAKRTVPVHHKDQMVKVVYG